MTKKGTGYFAAWIASNGRSGFPKPRELYDEGDIISVEQTGEGWDKDGNDSAPVKEGFHIHPYGGFTYVSQDKRKVALVIESSKQVFSGLLRSWGVSDD